jgi:cell division protease FtsH
MLGGRTAEEVVFNEISTGAQDDLDRASRMARSMVAEYGMSDKLGPATYGAGRRPLLLEETLPPSRPEVSEATMRELDEEVRALVGDAHNRAREILASRREVLDRLAHALLEKETLEGDELRAIVGEAPIKNEAAD